MGSLFLVRHSTTEASEAGVMLGQKTDAPLTPAGMELAARTAAAIVAELSALPHDALRVISSPALRCRQTADAISAAVGAAEPQVEPAIWEIDYGAWEGLSTEEARRRDPQLRASYEADPYEVRIPGGESGRDVAARAFPVLEAVERWLAEDRARAAVVVSHNHVVRLRLAALLVLPLSEYRRRIVADPAGYSLVTFGAGVPVIRRINAMPADG